VAANLGAHEVMEIHEVLNGTVDAINQMQLLRQRVRDRRLAQILDHQLQFAVTGYNAMVDLLHRQGAGQAAPYRAVKSNFQPAYGLDHPGTVSPNTSPDELDDRDIASILLGLHKASAAKKILAALECANPEIRRAMQQGAINCAEQAYEVWQYMNEQGYYQVPTLKDVTTQTMSNIYQPFGTPQNVPTSPAGVQWQGQQENFQNNALQ
jgi:spore coat protein CotF